MIRYRLLIALAAIATALVLVAADANARAGGGFSGGSRGLRTFSAPPPTRTAPTTAAPIQRTITQPGSAAPARSVRRVPVLFGGGLFGGLAAGFLGAGLFGLLFGHGFFGGMGGFASILGLLLQVVLVVFVARLLLPGGSGVRCRSRLMRRRIPRPATASAGLGGMFGGSRRPVRRSPSTRRTTMPMSNCSATCRPLIRRKTCPRCAPRRRPRWCPISPSN